VAITICNRHFGAFFVDFGIFPSRKGMQGVKKVT